MSPKSKKQATNIQRIIHRPGEGHTVDITISAGDGNENIGHMDLGNLPVPDRRFACDAVGIKVLTSEVQLFFAQSKPIGDGLLSLLVLNMAFEAVGQFLHSAPLEFAEQFHKAFPGHPEVTTTDFQHPADQTVVLAAGIVLAGYTGTNGCMDFYYASPFSQQQIATMRRLSVESVVRVNLAAPLMFAIIKALRDAETRFPNLKVGE